ncbi:unnamed protein product [Ilex paraguariensis]|uniref:Uncharacterized protein n=1 Tax=Ilex paraguariensis TaxID=185542 RepID=A0ABC8T2N7_9AQUA
MGKGAVNKINSREKDEKAVESWRQEKIKEAKQLTRGKTINSTILIEEAGIICFLSVHLLKGLLLQHFKIVVPVGDKIC